MFDEADAAWERAELDKDLLRAGERCRLQRGSRIVELRASIRDYRPAELTGGNGLQAGDSHVIISTTEIDAAQWPDAATLATTTAGDPRIPIKGDKLILSNGRVRIVQAAWPALYIGGELIRIELTIK